MVCDATGREVPDEDHVQGALAQSEARGRAEGLLVGTAMLLRLLTVRFGPPSLTLEAWLLSLTDLAALDAPSLEDFVAVPDRASG